MSEFDLEALMQQAQQMQQQMASMQQNLEQLTVEGSAGAGMVKVTATGTQRVTAVNIDPSVIGEDQEMLQDLIAAAVNNAMDKARELAQKKMGSLLPSGFDPSNMPGMGG